MQNTWTRICIASCHCEVIASAVISPKLSRWIGAGSPFTHSATIAGSTAVLNCPSRP